jgi:hypothetical protein
MAIASKFLPRVKKKVIAVEKLLEGSVAAEKKKVDDAKREASEERKAKSEEQLEKKEEKGDKLPFKKQRQKVGDFLSNFITNMLLGAAVMKLVEFTQTDTFKSFIDGIAAVADFIENVGGFLLNGLITFVDWAYGLYDGLRGFVYDNFGEEGLKKFDTFMENFNTFLNTALIAIMAFLKFKFLRVGLGKLGGFITKIFRRGILRAAKRLGLKFFGKAATKFLGKGLSAAKGLLSKGVSAIGKGVGGLAAKIFGKSAGVIAPALKGAMGAVKNFFGRIPIVGPIVVAIVSLLSGEPPAQAIFKALGAALGGALGTFIPIPVLGTLLGETIGAFVGDLLYYGIIEGNWKKAGKVFGQTLSAILSAGGKVLEYIGGVGKRFFGDFPTVDVPDFRLGELIGDMLTKVPVIGDIVNFELKIPSAGHFALNFIPGIPEEFKTALKEGFSIREVLNSLPGLREVLGAFAQFIPGLSKFVENGALMKIPNLLLLTLPGLPFLVPHIGKSLFPGLFDGKKGEARTDVPPPPDSSGGFMDFLSGGTSTTTATAPTGGGQPMLRGSDEGGTGIPDEGSGTTASGTTSKRMITGPAGYDRIGAGAAYHVDTKFHSSLGMSGMISAMDQMANAYAARGKEIVFSGQGYARLKAYSSELDAKEKKKLLNSAIDAHSHSTFMRAQGFKPFDYYIPDISANKDLYHPSTEKAEILLPNFGGETKVGALYGGYGKSADMFDSSGKHIAMTGHGDLAYAKGGFTKAMAHRAILGERGKEFVIDADSTAALEGTFPGFLQAINRADGNAALEVLRNYASYDSNEPEQVLVPVGGASGGTPAPQQSGGVVTESAGGDDDPFERLYMGG